MKTDLVVGAYIINEGKVLLILHKKLGIWIPPGGHIEKDEAPDEAVAREILEELGLRIRLLNHCGLPVRGNAKKYLANPFCVNIHPVGDHDHCCFYYVCEALNPGNIQINKNELLDLCWFSVDELNTDKRVPADVKDQALLALRHNNLRRSD